MVNKVFLLGSLGKDPMIKTTPSGAKVANFSMATNETYKDSSGERQKKTEWHNVVLWRGLAEVAEKYLHKGSQVFIEGKLTTRSWEKPDGTKVYTTEIVGDNMQMVGKREGSSQPETPASYQENPDGLPF